MDEDLGSCKLDDENDVRIQELCVELGVDYENFSKIFLNQLACDRNNLVDALGWVTRNNGANYLSSNLRLFVRRLNMGGDMGLIERFEQWIRMGEQSDRLDMVNFGRFGLIAIGYVNSATLIANVEMEKMLSDEADELRVLCERISVDYSQFINLFANIMECHPSVLREALQMLIRNIVMQGDGDFSWFGEMLMEYLRCMEFCFGNSESRLGCLQDIVNSEEHDISTADVTQLQSNVRFAKFALVALGQLPVDSLRQ